MFLAGLGFAVGNPAGPCPLLRNSMIFFPRIRIIYRENLSRNSLMRTMFFVPGSKGWPTV